MTELEQQLREAYVERLGALDLSGGDLAAARRTGARMRGRRRLAVGAAAIAVVAVAIGGSMIGSGRMAVGPSSPSGQWRELPAAPLSPRANAESVWTGHEVIVLGGETEPCPPNADCAAGPSGLRDGAAFDPTTNTWRRIASAPVPVGPGDRLLAAGDLVVLRSAGTSAWFVFDPARNHWLRLRDVPKGVGGLPSSYGSLVYALAGRQVVSYDASSGAWSTLPPDPITPALRQRRVTATSSGPVVTGVDATKPHDGSVPPIILADVFDGTSWHRLPATGQIAGNSWTWTGTRMVDPEPFTLDGGEVDGWGRAYPMGGILDPASGTWTSLPEALVNASQGDDRGWVVSAAGGSWIAVLGQVYDDSTGRLYRLDRPNGAPAYGTTAAWADGRLVVFGGTDFNEDTSCRGPGSTCAQLVDLTNHAWLWTP
ncbi:MAG TPA: hypothetical protein VGK78_14855 [Nocardioides sp.]|uniref:hypothetical protein n=1 Tax=Nocardioides sp. TaxID=35761 RepID=UPI002F427BB5